MNLTRISRAVILFIIYKYRPHGYELMKIIARISNGLLTPGPGTIYPLLFLLKKRGLIREVSEEGERRKRYEVTEQGKEFLREVLPSLKGALLNFLDVIEYFEKNEALG
ncbi:MAG: PadR family transcriptional regulator [Crenarchaeota archaeon]|nr:PadR family transcriptional regulator [Thermoproteota archaeon]